MELDLSLAHQELRLLDDRGETLSVYRVSTATNGPGERNGSECTPRGAHRIRAKIGTGCPVNTVFRGRRPTGEIYGPALRRRYPHRDWILTRILWLSGLEPGFNRLGEVDTMRRFIYIHGAPEEDLMGVPSSHGCVKMRNHDVLELFDRIPPGTPVNIRDE
ncbi:MAG: L,D-transpeptidase [Arenicellales bacterium]|jgi:lipoprotein-anchoring transpeptidase ErfK/SrfK